MLLGAQTVFLSGEHSGLSRDPLHSPPLCLMGGMAVVVEEQLVWAAEAAGSSSASIAVTSSWPCSLCQLSSGSGTTGLAQQEPGVGQSALSFLVGPGDGEGREQDRDREEHLGAQP
jgi:hypothetical protein